MPAVIETHERDFEHVETSDLSIERPQPRRARPGFWRSLVHKITTHLSPTPREQHTPLCSAPHPFEAPMDRLVREYPSLSVYALALI